MTTYTFDPPSWGEADDITLEKLQKVSTSLNYLNSAIPRMWYHFDTPNYGQEGGIAVYATNTRLKTSNPSVKLVSTDVRFPDGLFDPSYSPIVTATLGFRSDSKDLILSVTSLSSESGNWPSASGCRVYGAIPSGSDESFTKLHVPIHVIAIGPKGGGAS